MTNTPAQLSELVERVEAATGPDRELDARIRATLEMPEQPVLTDCPAYTASIDAALALVERKLPGCHWQFSSLRSSFQTAQIMDNAGGYWEANAATPALAIILVLLRALAHQGAE